MIQVIRKWLGQATPAQRCIAAVGLATPFLVALLLIQSATLLVDEWRALVTPRFVILANVILLACIVAGCAVVLALWRHRFHSRALPKTSTFVACLMAIAFPVEAFLGGMFTYPISLAVVGIIPIGVLLLDLRSVGIAFCLGFILFWSADVATHTGLLNYAPGYGQNAFSTGLHNPAAEWLRSIILYVSLIAYGVITWVLFDQYDFQRQHLSTLARTDALTKLSNRRHFMQRVEEECLRQNRNSQPLCLVMMDVDFFKSVNDRFGHAAGDAVLTGVADALSEVLRVPADLLARVGGEEFALLLPDTDLSGAELVCERIEHRLECRPFSISGKDFYITLSMGVVESNGLDPKALIQVADANLYRAKMQGRNRIVLSSEEGLSVNARVAPLA